MCLLCEFFSVSNSCSTNIKLKRRPLEMLISLFRVLHEYRIHINTYAFSNILKRPVRKPSCISKFTFGDPGSFKKQYNHLKEGITYQLIAYAQMVLSVSFKCESLIRSF